MIKQIYSDSTCQLTIITLMLIFIFNLSVCYSQVEENYASKLKTHDTIVYNKIRNGLYGMELDDFLAYVDTIISSYQMELENSELNNSLTINQFRYETKRIDYIKATILITYTLNSPEYKCFNTGISLTNKYFNYIKKLDLNDTILFQDMWYKKFIFRYNLKYAYDEIKTNRYDSLHDNILTKLKLDFTISRINKPIIKDYLLKEILLNHINIYGTKNIDTLLTTFNEHCLNSKFKQEVKAGINRANHTNFNIEKEIYKNIKNTSLELHIIKPDNWHVTNNRPVFLFFHGGGWQSGKAEWGYEYCNYFASKGMVGISVEYRIRDRHNNTPIEAIEDAKSAVNWVRNNAEKLGVDKSKIIASGISAGGHLAASIIFSPENDAISNISPNYCKANALILWSPCLNSVKDSTFQMLLGKTNLINQKKHSPYHNVQHHETPVIVFHGSNDVFVPYQSIDEFYQLNLSVSNNIELHKIKNNGHFFFQNEIERNKTLKKSFEFLEKNKLVNY